MHRQFLVILSTKKSDYVDLVKRLLSSTVFIITLIVQDAFATSWTYPKGTHYIAESVYYSFHKPQFFVSSHTNNPEDLTKSNLPEPVYMKATAQISRHANTFDHQYGLRDDLTIFGKLDTGYENDHLRVEFNNNETKQSFEFDNQYVRLDSSAGFRKQIYKEDFKALANSWYFHPGEFVFRDAYANYTYQNSAIATKLHYGHSFKHNFWWAESFQGYKDPGLYHYFEWEAGIKCYPEPWHAEFSFDIHFGFRPGTRWAFSIGVNNIFNGYKYDGKSLNKNLMAFLLNQMHLAPEEKDVFYDDILTFINKGSTYNFHQLNLRADYYLTGTKTIGLETYNNIFTGRPFKDTTILLNYSLSY